MTVDDRELVEQARSGSSTAYAELIGRHHARVLGLCVSMLGERSAADDAAQETFLKAYRSLGSFQGVSSFSTWLYRIASNVCLDMLRGRARRATESWDALLEHEGENMERLLRAAPDAELRREQADLVDRALACLPPDYRLVLTLREAQGLSYQELMEALDCSLDAVKARLRRARRELAERLRHFLGPDDV